MADPDFPKGGRRIQPPPGLPSGWEALEKQFLSGSKAGEKYVRFQGGKHKNVCTVKQAVTKDAEDRGVDVAAALADYDELKRKIEEEKEEERQAKGKVSKEQAEEAVVAFEAKFGKLEAAVIPKIPGWSYQTKWQETSGQTQVTYYAPDKTPYGTVKAVEVVFGLRLLRGEVVDVIDKARDAFIEEHGSLDPGYNPLRRTADGETLMNAIRSGNTESVQEVAKIQAEGESRKSRSQKKHRIDLRYDPLPHDYLDSPTISVVAGKNAPKDAFAQKVEEVKRLLLVRGFEESTQFMVVHKELSSEHQFADMLVGVYYEKAGLVDDRPCFQWVNLTDTKTGLVCQPLYIYWRQDSLRWELGRIGGSGHRPVCLGFSASDKPTPLEVESSWMLLREDFKW